jgi:hypothetical protein
VYARAIGAVAAIKISAAKAAKLRFFIGILHLSSGEMSGFDIAMYEPQHHR